jgi:hypothetical protein
MTMNNNIKQVVHEKKTPVRIERDFGDVIIIEGVKYAGDMFREFAIPNSDVLYAVRRDEFGSVALTTIRSLDEAKSFFDPTPLPAASPQIGEEHPDLGGEDQHEENENVI